MTIRGPEAQVFETDACPMRGIWRPAMGVLKSRRMIGAVAQLGERRVRNAKVEGSIPFRSTNPFTSHGASDTGILVRYDRPG